MSRRISSIILAIGAASFLAMAFGITLHLHLAHVDETKHHDSDHCPICQNFLISKKEYTVEFASTEIEIDTVGQLVSTRPTSPAIQHPFLQQCHSRAPPA